MSAPIVLHRSERLSAHRVPHGFTDRRGGASVGRLAELNLGKRPEESDEALRENWRRVVAAVRPERSIDDVAIASQVHGSAILTVDRPSGPLTPLGEADALITLRDDVLLAIRVADCVPILVYGPSGVAAIHSGWRGTALDVAGATIRALAALTGDDPARMVAAVGPSISLRSYEVGDEVVQALAASGFHEDLFADRRGQRPHVDVGAVVVAQLARAGVGLVERLPGCTFADPEFYSHRREGAGGGRQAAVIGRV